MELIQVIISALSGGLLTGAVMLRSKRRAGETESYKLLLDDLNIRMESALSRMRELEEDILRLKAENEKLREENARLRKIVEHE